MPDETPQQAESTLSKVAAVTWSFWIIKILCTTLGETGGDAVTMSMNLGYLVGTLIFAAIFIAAVAAQIASKRFHASLYWFTIIATTTVGTTMADFADRSLGIGYAGGSATLLVLLLGSLAIWHRVEGTVSVETVRTPRTEIFYWVTIMFSQTLGTALGDWAADDAGLGYRGGVLAFGSLLVVLAGLYFFTKLSRTFLFWSAFIITRPLGAVLGDLLDKPLSHGGMNASRYTASAILAGAILLCIVVFPRRAAQCGAH